MIFIKNPIPGKVKTRLGKDIGHEKAVTYYKKLLEITRKAALGTEADRWLWYGDFVNEADAWSQNDFEKKLQHEGDLGQRMKHAFLAAFDKGYEKVAIIGSDCPEMNSEILQKAFVNLESVDAVIGPANDGGYYLLAMKKPLPIFEDVEWSTENVLGQTITHLQNRGLSYLLLEELTDLDTIEDLKHFPEL
jgi:hypothetical protein